MTLCEDLVSLHSHFSLLPLLYSETASNRGIGTLERDLWPQGIGNTKFSLTLIISLGALEKYSWPFRTPIFLT